MVNETPLQPPVLGGAELRPFTGDHGGHYTEVVLAGQSLLAAACGGLAVLALVGRKP